MKFVVYNKITEEYEDGDFYIDRNGKLFQKISYGYNGDTMLLKMCEEQYTIEWIKEGE